MNWDKTFPCREPNLQKLSELEHMIAHVAETLKITVTNEQRVVYRQIRVDSLTKGAKMDCLSMRNLTSRLDSCVEGAEGNVFKTHCLYPSISQSM